MKKIFVVTILLSSPIILSAQWQPQNAAGTDVGNVYHLNGNVGIGTAAPTTKLEINNGNAAMPSFLKVNPTDAWVQLSLLNTSVNSNSTTFDIKNTRGASGVVDGGYSALSLTYDASAVLPNTEPTGSTLWLINDNVNAAVLQFRNQNSTYTMGDVSKLIELNGSTGNKFARTSLATLHATHFRWEFDNVEKMRITSAGNVGIGTSLTNNPNSYKLAVNGKIGAKEVQVENTSSTWADYVFESDYKLRSLTDVETFIKVNKHLPEIPSADEVRQNGHKLGEMDVLLLKKVEELTLYVIELQKQVNEQSNQILQLKTRK